MLSARLAKVFLIVIWMAVTPVPVVVLVFVALFVIRAITFMALAQVTAIGVVFAVIPIVVVMVARIVHSDLNGLRCRGGRGGSACRKRTCQE
jgi:hypothetical protein